MKAAPCYTCTRRRQGCHGSCRLYVRWKALHQLEKAQAADQARADSEATRWEKYRAYYQYFGRKKKEQ